MVLQSTSHLLALPLELRNLIYLELLDPPADPSHPRIIYHDWPPRPPLNIHASILRTCRQIYKEAKPVLYDSATPFVIFLATTPPGPTMCHCDDSDEEDHMPRPDPGPFWKERKTDYVEGSCNQVTLPGAPGRYSVGLIEKEVLMEIRNLEIVASSEAMWPWGTYDMRYQAFPVSLILQIVGALNDPRHDEGGVAYDDFSGPEKTITFRPVALDKEFEAVFCEDRGWNKRRFMCDANGGWQAKWEVEVLEILEGLKRMLASGKRDVRVLKTPWLLDRPRPSHEGE